jgi:hypothetical protein
VKPRNWVKYFDELFSRKINGGIVYETKLFGPQCIEELDSGLRRKKSGRLY